MKYPIGIQSFDQIREDGFVYVDKTEMVYDLVKTGKVYLLSRPRRFGKSLLVSTLACYFQGRKELFDGLAIASLEKDWLKYPIFRIDFNGEPYTQPGILEATIESYIANWEAEYGKNPLDTTIGARFRGVLRRAYEQTGLRAVVLIDEYDKPILDVLDTGTHRLDHAGEKQLLEDHHRQLLATFYLLLRLLGVYCLAIHCEDRQSYGRVDCTLEMYDYIYIFEFKLDGTAREALEQIEKMGYAKPYVADKRKVIRIGVSFSSTTRTVEDWEEA